MKVRINKTGAARLAALLGLALAICVALLGGSGRASAGVPAAQAVPGSPLGKVEQRVLDDTANGRSTQFMVLLAQQADLSAAYGMRDQDARGWYVYNTLRDYANATQAPLRAMLNKAGASYQSYWVTNALLVTGDRSLVESIASRPEVGRI